MRNTTIVYQHIWYLPTFLKDKDSPKSTLIGHVYTIRRSQAGNYNLGNKIGAWEFANESELTDFITRNKARELPTEADGRPQYVPVAVKSLLASLRETS